MENKPIQKGKVTLLDFYSIWITIYLISFVLLNTILNLPKWLSPFYSVIGACLGQIVMFIIGWNAQPRWYIVASIIWKISILLLAILLTSNSLSLETTLWSSICFLSYLLYIKYQKNKTFKNIYYDAMKNPKSYQNLLQNIKTIFPFLF
jgi:hypothetical protein